MNSHIGKMRNVFGELQSEKYEDIKSCEVTTEGFLADANNKYIAVKYFKFIFHLVLMGNWWRWSCSYFRSCENWESWQ
jgi:hypothetical protein